MGYLHISLNGIKYGIKYPKMYKYYGFECIININELYPQDVGYIMKIRRRAPGQPEMRHRFH